MFITRTVTKKILETIVHETFSTFGSFSSSSLLDSLKLLGFYYATNAGVSINIEDLKTPGIKKEIIKSTNQEISNISELWQKGLVSDIERFQTIIDSWNIATELLKNKIIDYYQLFDPANNLYIMAFSGARGNMSQVRQLVGMRGLMSDQEGNIIDLPIQANFREGLTSIDYIVSSYGARKGIVDTALKTADSGYLTRRLIYLAQDLIIREFDCQTKQGLVILLNKKTNIQNIVGRHLIYARILSYPYRKIVENEQMLSFEFLKNLKEQSPIILNIRSSLMCESNGSICQKCYGVDLAQDKLISLGDAVGIIAAQSIGEPGTQLTMRTFHTGGIFTSEAIKQIVAPFSGKIIFPESFKTKNYRTNHGTNVFKIQQETRISILNWKGIQEDIFLPIGSNLYMEEYSFVKKGQLIAENANQSLFAGKRRLKPIYTSLTGEILFEKLIIKSTPRHKRYIGFVRLLIKNEKGELKEKITCDENDKNPNQVNWDEEDVTVNYEDGAAWIAGGKIFPLPKEIKYKFPTTLNTERSFATLKLITPYQGLVFLKENQLIILNEDKKLTLELLQIITLLKNCSIKIFTQVRNCQYVDPFTVVIFLQIFPNCNGLIYSSRKKESEYISTLFLITESDIWKMNSDQLNDFSFFKNQKTIIRAGMLVNTSSKFRSSGIFLKKDGFKMIFQKAAPIFLNKGAVLNYDSGDFVFEKEIFATLINYTQQTEDIVQGLPKIEEIIEARHPKIKCFLSNQPGVVVESEHDSLDLITLSSMVFKGQRINSDYDVEGKVTGKTHRKAHIFIAHSLFLKDEMMWYNNSLFKVIPIPPVFKPIENFDDTKKEVFYRFQNDSEKIPLNDLYKIEITPKDDYMSGDTLIIDGHHKYSRWFPVPDPIIESDFTIKKYKQEKLIPWATVDVKTSPFLYRNKKENQLIKTNEFGYLYLERLQFIKDYSFPTNFKKIVDLGQFIDIGEPITEGMVDLQELLMTFFKYHSIYNNMREGTLQSFYKFQLLLVNSIQAIYDSQGVSIASPHIEIIVRQMTSKVHITNSGDTPLLPGELIRVSLATQISHSLRLTLQTNQISDEKQYKTLEYEPVLLSATGSSLSKDGFLSAAGFQETKRILTKAAIEGSVDWLRGLKESIIIGRLIPGGSTFLNYKSYLDNVYLFKK
jgi:hypothetical protein